VTKHLRITTAVILHGRCEVLRKYILTAKEKEIIRLWFEEGNRVTGFYQLLGRSRKQISRIREDLEQLEIFVRSFEK